MTFAHLVPHYIPPRPRLVLCDVDRTLLTHAHVLPEQVRCAARALPFPLVLASARSPTGVRPIAEAVGAERLAVCFNGAWIGSLDGSAPLYTAPIPLATAHHVFDTAQAAGFAPAAFVDDHVTCHPGDAARVAARTAVTGDRLLPHGPPETPPCKLLLSPAPDDLPRCLASIAALSSDICVAQSGPGLVEVTHAQATKGHALRWLADHLGIDAAQIAAAGDSDNDRDMLRAAGVALAPQNAAPAVQRLADLVVPHCDLGGMARGFGWLADLPGPQTVSLKGQIR